MPNPADHRWREYKPHLLLCAYKHKWDWYVALASQESMSLTTNPLLQSFVYVYRYPSVHLLEQIRQTFPWAKREQQPAISLCHWHCLSVDFWLTCSSCSLRLTSGPTTIEQPKTTTRTVNRFRNIYNNWTIHDQVCLWTLKMRTYYKDILISPHVISEIKSLFIGQFFIDKNIAEFHNEGWN